MSGRSGRCLTSLGGRTLLVVERHVVTRELVVDDDPQLLRALRITLTAQDFGVELAVDGQSVLLAVAQRTPDVVVLDLGLPDVDGVEVLRRIRQQSDVPVIVLSARHETPEKIRALDEGADDYITKPFGMPEMLARLRAAARRAGAMARRRVGIVRTPDFVLDFGRKEALKGEMTIRLTPTEWRLLEVLAAQAGTLVPQRELLQSVWGPGCGREANYLRMAALNEPHPSSTRVCAGDPAEPADRAHRRRRRGRRLGPCCASGTSATSRCHSRSSRHPSATSRDPSWTTSTTSSGRAPATS
jgi:two-component system KDP operon response regulator KdpE